MKKHKRFIIKQTEGFPDPDDTTEPSYARVRKKLKNEAAAEVHERVRKCQQSKII